MEKSIKLIIAGLLCSSIAAAQVADSIQHYGRGISFSKKEATTAGGMATADELSHRTSTVASNALFGLIPGLQVLQNGGNEWENGATLYVRGVGTTSGKSPLILIDGYERDINNLAVQDIESVSVLKDAASLALYGIRGANGVVLIKTKRGYVGKPIITFDYEFKMGTPHRLPEFVDGYTYAQAMNEGLKNDGITTPRYSQRELDAFHNQTYPEFYSNVDWMDEALRDHSFGNNANLSIRGGGDIVQYFTQLNYLNDKGILQPTEANEGYSTQFKYSKLNFLTNLDIKLGNTTKLQLNMRGNFAEDNRPYTTTADIFDMLYKVPSGAMPIKTSNGRWGATSIYGSNPIAMISDTGYERGQNRNLYADLSFVQDLSFITEGLSATARLGFDNEARYWERNQHKYATEQVTMGWDGAANSYKKLTEETALDFSSSIKDVVRRLTVNAQVNYDRTWGTDHKLNATVLYSMDKMTKRGRNAGRAFMDIVGQAHYTYKNRYLLDFALSGSASSILNPDDRWGIFPSVGAGWILSEESAFKADWLNMLKLRASYGIAGRADYGVQLFRGSYSGGGSYYFGETPASIGGMKESRLAVDGLTYEKSHKLNAGIDFVAWNRLSLSVDGYYDHRTDILVDGDGALSSVLGISAPDVNNGIVNSYGVEVAANWNDKIGEVIYQLGGQFSFNRNEIKEMNEVYRPYDYLKRTGRPVNQYFGYEVEGIYQSWDDIENREVKQLLDEVRPGDLKFKDQNGDKVIDEYDQVALGYGSVCPEIYYGFNLGAEYKGLGFTALFQGAANYSQMLDTRSVYRPLVSNNTVSQHYYDNRWTENNPDAKYPRLTYNGSKNNYNTNSLWVADASFLKLRTLEVYYNLPQKWMNKLPGVNRMRLFMRAHDLFSIDKMDGVIDPEMTGTNHPLMTQYTFGVNLRF